MLSWENARLLYLLLFIAVFLLFFMRYGRKKQRSALRALLVWGMIFALLAVGYDVWQDASIAGRLKTRPELIDSTPVPGHSI